MVSTRKNRGIKGGRLSRTMRGGGGYNIFLVDGSGALTPYAHVGTGNIFGSTTNMSGEKVIKRIYGKFVRTEKEGKKFLTINNVEALQSPPPALHDAEATQYYTAHINTNDGEKNAFIARYKKKNKANRKYRSFGDDIITIGNETGMLGEFAGIGPDQERHHFRTNDSMQSVLPSTPHGDDDQVDFGRWTTGYEAGGRSKNKGKSRKKKNPHKKKKGSKHVKSKKKGKTRKNMHGGGEAYYVVTWNSGGKVFPIAKGHVYSFLLPSDFGWVEPHELHPAATIFKKKIENEMDNRNHKKTLLDIVLEHAKQEQGYNKKAIADLKEPSNWEVGPHYIGHLRQSITNDKYTIQRYNQRPSNLYSDE